METSSRSINISKEYSIMIKSIYTSESHLCSSKQIIISLKCLCLSYITMRNNDTINNKLTRTFIHRHMITILDYSADSMRER